MSEIILPQEEEKEQEINYEATETDEECFFLMYHMNMAPSEAYALEEVRRKWIIGRFVAQKNMEREMMERHRLMSQLGPNIKA